MYDGFKHQTVKHNTQREVGTHAGNLVFLPCSGIDPDDLSVVVFVSIWKASQAAGKSDDKFLSAAKNERDSQKPET